MITQLRLGWIHAQERFVTRVQICTTSNGLRVVCCKLDCKSVIDMDGSIDSLFCIPPSKKIKGGDSLISY